MEQEKDDIGQLFRSSFEGHKQAPEREEWEMLQASMQRLNFFKFNALQFNIYYAGMIAFCFLTCLGMGSHYTFTHVIKPHHQLQGNSVVTKPADLEDESSIQEESNISNPADLENKVPSGTGESHTMQNPAKGLNNYKPVENDNQISEAPTTNAMTEDLNTDLKPFTLSNQTLKIDSIHKNVAHKHKQNITETDSSKNKKRTLYITRQDTIYKYDTLRAPKPKRRRF